MERARKLQEVVAVYLRRRPGQVQNADSDRRRRTRLSRPLHPVPRILQRPATPRRSIETGRLPRRRTLGSKTPKRAILVQNFPGLARHLSEVVWSAAPLRRFAVKA